MILIRIDLFIRLVHRLELRIQKSIWLSSDNSGNFLTNKINKYSTNSGNQIFFFFFFIYNFSLSFPRYLEPLSRAGGIKFTSLTERSVETSIRIARIDDFVIVAWFFFFFLQEFLRQTFSKYSQICARFDSFTLLWKERVNRIN